MATIALRKPRNLGIVVLDNGHFGETGMQPSHAGQGIELARVAEGEELLVYSAELGLVELPRGAVLEEAFVPGKQ